MNQNPASNPERVAAIARRASELAKELHLDATRAIGAALTEAGIMDIHDRQNFFGPVAKSREFKIKKGPTRPHGMDAVEAETRLEPREEQLPERRVA